MALLNSCVVDIIDDLSWSLIILFLLFRFYGRSAAALRAESPPVTSTATE